MSYIPAEDLRAHATRLEADIRRRTEPLRPKERAAIPAQEMPAQDPQVRKANFKEVATGYSAAQAKVEAERCLRCAKKPCVNGCPVRIDIPAFVTAIAEEDPSQAIETIKRASLLPAICGRVCPQEAQCQEHCTLGKMAKDRSQSVAIGRLERYVADLERERGIDPPPVKPETGKHVGIVGSGPASLVVAADVRREGHAVTILEAFHRPGGVMVYGIPEFRLPKAIVRTEIDTLKAMGVALKTDFVVGRTRKLKDLLDRDGYDAIFIGSGAGLPTFMNIEGENLVGVFSANEYLTRVNLMKAYDRERADTPIMHSRRVAVLGGGNVAMDAARTALRLGAEKVSVVYRRTEKEMPARVEEVTHAKEEGIDFLLLQNAKRILGNEKGHVSQLECLRYELGEPDDSGRRRPVAIEGSEFKLAVDTVIVAIGNSSNPLIAQTCPELETNQWGNISVDENLQTSIPGIFAGGDIVLGAATVILAMGQGRLAASGINKRLAHASEDAPVPRD